MTRKMVFHPLSIAFGILSVTISVGVPGYIAAFVANRGFIQNSTIIGVITLFFLLLNIQLVIQFPMLIIVFSIFTLCTAYLSGLYKAGGRRVIQAIS
jgi:hypothetical protein